MKLHNNYKLPSLVQNSVQAQSSSLLVETASKLIAVTSGRTTPSSRISTQTTLFSTQLNFVGINLLYQSQNYNRPPGLLPLDNRKIMNSRIYNTFPEGYESLLLPPIHKQELYYSSTKTNSTDPSGRAV